MEAKDISSKFLKSSKCLEGVLFLGEDNDLSVEFSAEHNKFYCWFNGKLMACEKSLQPVKKEAIRLQTKYNLKFQQTN